MCTLILFRITRVLKQCAIEFFFVSCVRLDSDRATAVFIYYSSRNVIPWNEKPSLKYRNIFLQNSPHPVGKNWFFSRNFPFVLNTLVFSRSIRLIRPARWLPGSMPVKKSNNTDFNNSRFINKFRKLEPYKI